MDAPTANNVELRAPSWPILDERGKAMARAHGDLLKATNPLNDSTTYDVATSTFNLTKISSPTGGTGGTADYRPTSVTDAQGNTTALTYNSWGQTATSAVGAPAGGGSPAGGTWSYKYQGGSGSTAASCGGKPGRCARSPTGTAT